MDGRVFRELAVPPVDPVALEQGLLGQVLENPVGGAVARVVRQDVVSATAQRNGISGLRGIVLGDPAATLFSLTFWPSHWTSWETRNA